MVKKFFVLLVALIGLSSYSFAQKFDAKYTNGTVTVALFKNGSCIVTFGNGQRYDATYTITGSGTHRDIKIILKDAAQSTYTGRARSNQGVDWTSPPNALDIKPWGELSRVRN